MNIGIQLHTVRAAMAESVPATLERIAAMGYDEVEFAGYFEQTPAAIQGLLVATGLRSPSAHISLDLMRSQPEETIAAAQTVGHDYLVLGWLAPEERQSLDQYRAHAELANRFAELCASAGIQFAWHNHDFEFEVLEGQRPMDLLLAQTDPRLVQMELDCYWVSYVGVDPFDYFVKHPGRWPLCHIKDMGIDRKMVDPGTGAIDFPALLAARDVAGFRHFYVEHDNAPEPLSTALAGYEAVKAMRF